MTKAKKTSIGGQALIEGIMMRGPDQTSVAVRKPDGGIALEIKENEKKDSTLRNLPFIRGVFSIIDSLSLGIDAMFYSASFWEDELEEEGEDLPGEDFSNGAIIASSVVLALVLFFFIPTLIGSFFGKFIDNVFLLNLLEGLIRIGIFLIYITAISRMKEMRRIFMYHGAEHKTIAAYENGLDLTVENVRGQSPYHPRCGTSFLFNVMLISVLVLSFFGWPNPVLRMVIRLLMLPVIAGISYELNKAIARSDSSLARLTALPGLFVQKIATVREPDDSMIEVAITAMEPVIPEEVGRDNW